jgi:hypothetical protein
MRKRYRLFKRQGVFYVHDSVTGKQESLRAKKRDEAEALYRARNEATHTPLVNRKQAGASTVIRLSCLILTDFPTRTHHHYRNPTSHLDQTQRTHEGFMTLSSLQCERVNAALPEVKTW